MVKKAQSGDMVSKLKTAAKKADSTIRKTGMNFDKKGFDSLPKLPMKKSKDGSSFGMLSVKAGIDKNPKATFADKIAGAKKKAMSGMEMMKDGGKKKMRNGGGILSAPKKDGLSMQLGTYKNVIGKNYTGKNVVNKGAKAKMGKSVGKCKNGC